MTDTSDRPIVELEWEGDAVVAVHLSAAWRSRGGIDALESALTDQLLDHSFGDGSAFDDAINDLVTSRLPGIDEMFASMTPQRAAAIPATTLSPERLSDLVQRMSEVRVQLHRGLPDQAKAEGDEEQVFEYPHVSILHHGDTVLSLEIERTWAKVAALESMRDAIASALFAFYAARPFPVPATSATALQAQLDDILVELAGHEGGSDA